MAGTTDSSEAADLGLRFLSTGEKPVCGVGWDDWRARALGEARGLEFAFGGGVVISVFFATSEELGLWAKLLLGVLKGFEGGMSGSSSGRSFWSLGRRDSVEP